MLWFNHISFMCQVFIDYLVLNMCDYDYTWKAIKWFCGWFRHRRFKKKKYMNPFSHPFPRPTLTLTLPRKPSHTNPNTYPPTLTLTLATGSQGGASPSCHSGQVASSSQGHIVKTNIHPLKLSHTHTHTHPYGQFSISNFPHTFTVSYLIPRVYLE